jgi:hypothetical protein
MYKGTVLQYLRKYIKDLQAEQLESYVLAGELTLHAIELEPEAMSEWISDILPYTVEIEKVFCSKVDIKIPWAQLRTKPVQIAVHQMEMTLLVHDFREQDWAVQQAIIQKNRLIQSRIVEVESVMDPEKSLKKMELSWIDYVAAGMQIRVEFCRLVLKSLSGSRIPPPPTDHSCPSSVPPTTPSAADPVGAFTLDIEGLFVAPCHHQSGWSVSYVETPEQVYQYDGQEKLLRLSRLITLKTFSVASTPSDKTIITHSPGFRMRLTSEFTCVNLAKRKRRFCIPPFPSRSNKALWMDKVNLSTTCSCELAAFYAMIQDLTAPVMVPPESLTQGNRPCHYTYRERDILTAQTEEELERLKGAVTDIKRPIHDSSETSSMAGRDETLPPLAEPKRPPKVKKKKGIVTSGSMRQDVRKLFAGLAKEVKDNANKAQEQMATTGKKLGSMFGGANRMKISPSSQPPLSPIASSREQDFSPTSEFSARTGNASPLRSRRIASEDSEYFTDAVSETGDSGTAEPKKDEPLIEGHEDAFAMWLDGELVGGKNFEADKEFLMSSQLVIIDKINFSSFFHIHVNELGLANGTGVSIVLKKLDMTSESHTPLTMTQLGSLASFAQFPQLFLMHAKKLTETVLLPSEPVHASTALSALSLSIIVKDPTTESPVTILKLEPKANGVKSLCLKWKSRTPPPTRLISTLDNGKTEIETGRMHPWEGCIHGMSVCASGWGPFLDLFNQCMTFAGEFPDPSFDPVMRLRMIVRDAELTVPDSGYKIAIPNGVLTRNFSTNKPSGLKIEDIMSGFQSLAAIPPVHFSDATREGTSNGQASSWSGFPFDNAFCSCVCGQETCSWSWALPTAAGPVGQRAYPLKIKLGDAVIGSVGTVTERTWKRALVHAHKSHVYVPSEDFTALVEAKLRLAEQDVVVDHLRDQYNAVMEEITKRNIFLKERWAADAVQTTSRENVVDVLTQKVCVLETLVRELSEAKDLAERVAKETRSVSANEIAAVRKDLLEETQKLRHKLDNASIVQDSLNEAVANREREIDRLKQQLEFLLGLGVKATNNVVTQTDSVD